LASLTLSLAMLVTRQSVTTSIARSPAAQRPRRDPLGQGRQDARRPSSRVMRTSRCTLQVLEAVGRVRARGFAQLGRQFDAGGAAADDDDVEAAGAPLLPASLALGLASRRSSLRRKRSASSVAFREIVCSRAPGTPK
jgi:hypothetical protein